jgi:hypothetical protein
MMIVHNQQMTIDFKVKGSKVKVTLTGFLVITKKGQDLGTSNSV